MSLAKHLSPSSWGWLRILLVGFCLLSTILLIHLLRQPGPIPYFFLQPEPALHKDYYQQDTPSFFPPSLAHETDHCAAFPSELLNDIQVVIKTGVGEADRAAAHLSTTSSCLRNAIVLSDVTQQIGEHRTIDILADLPDTYNDDDADFATYRRQKEAFEANGTVEYSHDGWKLDRFKFLPMVDRAFKMRPDARWYVFTEADVYIFWDSMFRLLHQYDSTQPLYLGAPVHGSYSRDFAYGGASFVISNALMRKLADADKRTLADQFELWAKDDCCGDAVIAYAIERRTKVRLTGLRPMFAGEDPAALSLNAENWCTPLISLHRVQPDEMHRLWNWERTRPYTQTPLVFSDFLNYTSMHLRNATTREFWDNVSDVQLPASSKAHRSLKQCADACHADQKCLQFSYTKGKCRPGHYLMKGHPVPETDGAFTSSWEMDRIAALGFDPRADVYPNCEHTYWGKPQKTPTDAPT